MQLARSPSKKQEEGARFWNCFSQFDDNLKTTFCCNLMTTGLTLTSSSYSIVTEPNSNLPILGASDAPIDIIMLKVSSESRISRCFQRKWGQFKFLSSLGNQSLICVHWRLGPQAEKKVVQNWEPEAILPIWMQRAALSCTASPLNVPNFTSS